MKRAPAITCLFLDIGGVLLTDGWDHHARKRAATAFRLKWAEIEPRHQLVFDTYEEGKLTLDDYLDLVVFHEKRAFTRTQFRRFMFAQSKPYPEMLELVARLKVRHRLKVVVVSNEARELNVYRISWMRSWIPSFHPAFGHVPKPDALRWRHRGERAQCPRSDLRGAPIPWNRAR